MSDDAPWGLTKAGKPRKRPPRTGGKGEGAPTDYRPEYCQQLLEYMTPRQIRTEDGKLVPGPYPMTSGFAHSLGVSVEVLYVWEKAHPEFFQAMKKAREMQERELFDGALANKYNPAVAIFGLKNNHGWKDKQEHEVSTGEGGLKIVVEYVGGRGEKNKGSVP